MTIEKNKTSTNSSRQHTAQSDKNSYEELLNLYKMMNDQMKLCNSYDEIVKFVNSSRISITEEEIKEHCLEHSSRKFKRLISKGKYELDLSLLQHFRSETSILRTNCQLLFDRLDRLIENKSDEAFSLKLGKLATEILHGVDVLSDVVSRGNDPETYFIYNKIEKKQREFPIQLFSYLFAGTLIFASNINSITSYFENKYYEVTNPYDHRRLTLSEDEINNIKKKLNPALTGKISEASLGDDNDDNIDNYFLLNAVYENEDLTDEEKDYLYDLIEIIEDNPYLNKEESYITFDQLKYKFMERPKDVSSYIKARFLPNSNKVEYFYDNYDSGYNDDIKKHTQHHEDIHALFNLPNKDIPSFFREGVTELLNREYLEEDPYSKYSGVPRYFNTTKNTYVDVYLYTYTPEMAAVKLLCDLVGSDKVLESYTKNDITIIYEELEKIIGTREDAETLIHTLNSDLSKWLSEDQLNFSAESKNIFNQLSKYKEAKFNSENLKENIDNKMNFDYNMTILKYIYSEKNNKEEFIERYESLVNKVGVLEKAYFYDELKNHSRNQIVNYLDRIRMTPTVDSNRNKVLEKVK